MCDVSGVGEEDVKNLYYQISATRANILTRLLCELLRIVKGQRADKGQIRGNWIEASTLAYFWTTYILCACNYDRPSVPFLPLSEST